MVPRTDNSFQMSNFQQIVVIPDTLDLQKYSVLNSCHVVQEFRKPLNSIPVLPSFPAHSVGKNLFLSKTLKNQSPPYYLYVSKRTSLLPRAMGKESDKTFERKRCEDFSESFGRKFEHFWWKHWEKCLNDLAIGWNFWTWHRIRFFQFYFSQNTHRRIMLTSFIYLWKFCLVFPPKKFTYFE